jgi:hypothetical protein
MRVGNLSDTPNATLTSNASATVAMILCIVASLTVLFFVLLSEADLAAEILTRAFHPGLWARNPTWTSILRVVMR